jgi:hypothetical protein
VSLFVTSKTTQAAIAFLKRWFEYKVGLLIVHLSKGMISFLSGGIPNFIFNDMIFELFVLGKEAATDSGLMCCGKLAVSISIRTHYFFC